jgi:hypothetical protein
MMIPAQIFIIPQYLMVSGLGLLNTITGLVFPGIVTAFGTYLLKTGYEGLPKDLEEAADIDGKIWFTTPNPQLRIAEGEMIDVKITDAMDYDLVGEAQLNFLNI